MAARARDARRLPLMALLTVWFRSVERAYRRRERIGLSPDLCEDTRHAGRPVVAREPRNQRSCRGINTRYKDANYGRSRSAASLPAVDFLPRSRPRSCSASRLPAAHDQVSVGRCSRSSSTWRLLRPVQQLSQLYNTFLSPGGARQYHGGARREPNRDASAAFVLPRIDGHVVFENVHSATGTCPSAPTNLAGVPAGHGGARRADGPQATHRELMPLLHVCGGPDHDDGHDVREVEQKCCAASSGRGRRSFLFAGPSPRTSPSRPRRDAGRVSERAAGAVGADGWIRSSRTATHALGVRGFRLSLGQRQLIAFARGCLAHPASSSSTRPPRRSTSARARDRGCSPAPVEGEAFVIAHRLSTIRSRPDLVLGTAVSSKDANAQLMAVVGHTSLTATVGACLEQTKPLFAGAARARPGRKADRSQRSDMPNNPWLSSSARGKKLVGVPFEPALPTRAPEPVGSRASSGGLGPERATVVELPVRLLLEGVPGRRRSCRRRSPPKRPNDAGAIATPTARSAGRAGQPARELLPAGRRRRHPPALPGRLSSRSLSCWAYATNTRVPIFGSERCVVCAALFDNAPGGVTIHAPSTRRPERCGSPPRTASPVDEGGVIASLVDRASFSCGTSLRSSVSPRGSSLLTPKTKLAGAASAGRLRR